MYMPMDLLCLFLYMKLARLRIEADLCRLLDSTDVLMWTVIRLFVCMVVEEEVECPSFLNCLCFKFG